MATTSIPVRALLIDGPDAGRVMQVHPSVETTLSPEEQEAWRTLMAASDQTEKRALRVRQKTDGLLAELRRVREQLQGLGNK